MRCRVVARHGISVSEPDNYHTYDVERSVQRAVLSSVSLEAALPQRPFWVPDFDGMQGDGDDDGEGEGEVAAGSDGDAGEEERATGSDGHAGEEERATGSDGDAGEEERATGSDGDAGETKRAASNDAPHRCERHVYCREPFLPGEYAERPEVDVDPATMIVARPEFRAADHDDTTVATTLVTLRHTIDPAVTPAFYLLVPQSYSTLDTKACSAIVPDPQSRHFHGDTEPEAAAKLRTQPVYLALRDRVQHYLANIDPLAQLVCDYCVSCTCAFDALVRRDARAAAERSMSVFECVFPRPYVTGAPLDVRVFGRIEHHGAETLLLACLGGARCGADGCRCCNLHDPINRPDPSLASTPSAPPVTPRPVPASLRPYPEEDSPIPIPAETAASVVLWCGEPPTLEQQVARCRRLLLARRDSVYRCYASLMADAVWQVKADRQKELTALESLLTKLYLPEHSAETLTRLATMAQTPLYATLSHDQDRILSYTALHAGAYYYYTGLPRTILVTT